MSVLQHFKGYEALLSRLQDAIVLMEKRNNVIITPFFSPDQLMIAKSYLGKQYQYEIFGGYEGCERAKIAILPFPQDIEFKITILYAKLSSRYSKIAHPDVLGAFMNLGLEREKCGDIILDDDYIYLIVDSDIASYVMNFLTKIRHTSISFQIYDGELKHQLNLVEKTYIVSSLRLDVLVSAFSHLSRAKAQQLIKSGLVKVNHLVLEDCSYLCYNNSVISIRGHGRFLFQDVTKKTKKDNFVITAAKYE